MRYYWAFILALLLLPIGSLQALSSDTISLQSLALRRVDSITQLNNVVVSGQSKKRLRLEPIAAVKLDPSYLHRHLSYAWVNTLATLPGVQAMSIGSGFGKPIIRGLGFNRVAYVEGDIKQEGQQWGADHGLEVDAFENSPVTVIKGPRSLLYGSDALGGVIVSSLPLFPINRGVYGEFSSLFSSVNGSLGASLLVGYSTPRQHFRLRYSEQHYGDLRVNADSITYLTIQIPIPKQRMKNTAGYNRAVKASYTIKEGGYNGFFQVSNLFEKVGFFPGAHGIPNLSRLKDDGKRYNIELPYSKVNHLKLYTRQNLLFCEQWAATLSLAYQQNHRSEWSLFHTHYATQQAPKVDPDKELELRLHSATARGEVTYYGIDRLKLTAVSEAIYKQQTIGGYGFLIPEYWQYSLGAGILAEYNVTPKLKCEGGIRYDGGRILAQESRDPYLKDYLKENGFDASIIEENSLRSKGIDRAFGSFSGSLGGAYELSEKHFFKAGVGMGFRFPGINELASNGVHHGSFRHERGDHELAPERALQLNFSYSLQTPRFECTLTAFHHYFFNYIYATPTGQWSVLPHSGQLFEFRQNRALLFGGEAELKWQWTKQLSYEANVDYVYTYNIDLDSPLPLSPPLRVRQTICYKPNRMELALTHLLIGDSNRIVPGEEPTAGTQLLSLYAAYEIPLRTAAIQLSLSASNLLNTTYYNHLSFYRRIGLPEEGRNYTITLKVTF